jgi:hypothetical protein
MVITRTASYKLNNPKPEIIGKDVSRVPVSFPKVTAKGVETTKEVEVLNNPKVQQTVELLYLFYDGANGQGKGTGTDIDEAIMKIMTDEKLNTQGVDAYIAALRSLNAETLSGNIKELKNGRDYITKFINGAISKQDAEI